MKVTLLILTKTPMSHTDLKETILKEFKEERNKITQRGPTGKSYLFGHRGRQGIYSYEVVNWDNIEEWLSQQIDRIREEKRDKRHTETLHAQGVGKCSCVYNHKGDQVGMCLRCSELTDKAYKKGQEDERRRIARELLKSNVMKALEIESEEWIIEDFILKNIFVNQWVHIFKTDKKTFINSLTEK